jgi:ABC-type multidrug transport system permease subunit
MAWKELLHVVRDRSTRFVFIIPMMQLMLFGYAIRIEVTDIPSAWVDLDQSQESRELVAAFANTETFELLGEFRSVDEAQAAIAAGEVHAVVVVPEDFSREVMRGEVADFLVLIDGSYSSEATAALNVSQQIALTQSRTVRAQTLERSELGRIPPALPLAQVDARPRLLFNPNLRTATFFVPGLVGIIMQLVTVLLTAFSIVRERENGTFEQLLTTPVTPWAMLLGKLMPYALIGVIETAAVLTLMVFVFGVPIVGSIALLAALSMIFLLTSLTVGILISTASSNQAEAMQLGFLLLLPSVLLSGFIFPLQSIPQPIRTLTFLIPVRYYIEILRGIILRGADLGALWDEALALSVYTGALLVISARRLRRRLD